jgi:hypothetical protein
MSEAYAIGEIVRTGSGFTKSGLFPPRFNVSIVFGHDFGNANIIPDWIFLMNTRADSMLPKRPNVILSVKKRNQKSLPSLTFSPKFVFFINYLYGRYGIRTR